MHSGVPVWSCTFACAWVAVFSFYHGIVGGAAQSLPGLGSWTLSGVDLGYSVLGSAVALEVYQNNFYVAFRGTDSNMYVSSSVDGVNWPAGASMIPLPAGTAGSTTSNLVALRSFGSLLFMAIEGTNSRMWIATFDGGNWTLQQEIGGALVGSALALEEFNGTLYAAFRGTDSNMYVSSSLDGINWPGYATRIALPSGTDGSTTPGMVALRTFGSRLFMAIQGQNSRMWISAFDGFTWTLQQEIGCALLGSPVALEVFGASIYVAFRGQDSQIYMASSADGTNWPGCATLINLPSSALTNSQVALRAFKSRLFIGINGESNNRMYLAYAGVGVTSAAKLTANAPLTFLTMLTTLSASVTVALLQGAF